MLDTYHRKGLYPMPPGGLGAEGAGVVVKAGSGSDEHWLNKRVAYFAAGALAEFTVVSASKLMEIPPSMDYGQALVLQIQGLTAHYLTHDVYRVKRGDQILGHACGSGTGSLAAQICARVIGAHVVGTCSTGKVANAKAVIGANADIVDYSGKLDSPESRKMLVAELKAASGGGGGFNAVYDGVGKSTFEVSLDVCKPRAMLTLFGNSSGMVPPFDPLILSQKGSLFLARPILGHFASAEELKKRFADLSDWASKGLLDLKVDAVSFPFDKAGEAQAYVEAGRATGKVVVRIADA